MRIRIFGGLLEVAGAAAATTRGDGVPSPEQAENSAVG